MFEIFCYTAAIVFVLWIRATPEPTVATPAPELVDDLPSLQELLTTAAAMTAPEPVEESTAAATVAATISTPVAVLQVATPAPVEESTATAWATLTSQELRRACQDRGIRWRNAHGAGRHLKKPEMVAALTA